MVDNRDRSEFEGGGVMPNTVFPKGPEALTASDKLRLQSITGQEEDSKAPPDPYHWYGNQKPDPIDESRVKERRKAIEDRDRYR